MLKLFNSNSLVTYTSSRLVVIYDFKLTLIMGGKRGAYLSKPKTRKKQTKRACLAVKQNNFCV